MHYRKLSTLSVGDLLKADTYGEEIQIVDLRAQTKTPLIHGSEEFFNMIYSEPDDSKIQIMERNSNHKRKKALSEWLDELDEIINSTLIFVEGFAGCGKTTFVQSVLSKKLKTYNYNYCYHNYDIGAFYEDKENYRILYSIRECFLSQLAKLILDDKTYIIDKVISLASEDEIHYLDTGSLIYNEIFNTKAFKYAKQALIEERDEAQFRESMHTQLKDLQLETILSVDCLLRLAYALVRETTESAIYVCYDNLDAIENFDELRSFDNTLASLRHNVDEYISKVSERYGLFPPHFVFFATYRKITAARVDIPNCSERCDDFSDEDQYIQYLDISRLYDFKEIVIRREQHFSSYLDNHNMRRSKVRANLVLSKELMKTEFVEERFSGFWNNNYRTCSSIIDKILKYYSNEANTIIDLYQNRCDGYNKCIGSYFGASSVFLSLICKVFNDGKMWSPSKLNLVTLGENKTDKSIYELTSLSRLIMTYMSNRIDSKNDYIPVRAVDIINEFSGIFDEDQVCSCLEKMLVRDSSGTWRRPIFYYRNALLDNRIADELKDQWKKFVRGNFQDTFTELLLCECGQAYVEILMDDFEFFSNRISNSNPSLFLIDDVRKADEIISNVYNAVECCCENMVEFCRQYMQIKGIDSYEKYVNLPIHPRTAKRNPQLHTERIIFSHISYLNSCRFFYLHRAKTEPQKKYINNTFVNHISNYLDLYFTYIKPINPRRSDIAQGLKDIINRINASRDIGDQYLQIAIN